MGNIRIFSYLLLALLTTSLLCSCQGSKKKKAAAPSPHDKIYPVKASEVIEGEIPDLIEIEGTFIPKDRLLVKSEFSGKTVQIGVAEGQVVNPGDGLCIVLNDSLSLILDKKRAELREEEIKLERLQKTDDFEDEGEAPPPQQILNAKKKNNRRSPFELDEVGDEEDRPIEEEDEGEEEPIAILPPKGATKPVNEEEAESNYALQQAKVDRLHAEIALTEKQVNDGNVVASIGGIIYKKFITEGTLIQPDTALFEIIDIDPILLSIFVPRNYVGHLNKNTPVKIFEKNTPDAPMNGEIVFISPEFNIDKKGLEVKISAPNHHQKIKVNMEGSAQLALSNRTRKVSLIPASALIKEEGKSYVYVIENNLAVKKQVDLGIVQDGQAAIYRGISLKEKVVSQGHATFDEEEEYIKIVE